MTDRTAWTWLVSGLRGLLNMMETEHDEMTDENFTRLEEFSERLTRLVERERKRRCTR